MKTVTVKSDDGETFYEGTEYELSEPSVRHWLNRRAAVRIDKPTTKLPEMVQLDPIDAVKQAKASAENNPVEDAKPKPESAKKPLTDTGK